MLPWVLLVSRDTYLIDDHCIAHVIMPFDYHLHVITFLLNIVCATWNAVQCVFKYLNLKHMTHIDSLTLLDAKKIWCHKKGAK